MRCCLQNAAAGVRHGFLVYCIHHLSNTKSHQEERAMIGLCDFSFGEIVIRFEFDTHNTVNVSLFLYLLALTGKKGTDSSFLNSDKSNHLMFGHSLEFFLKVVQMTSLPQQYQATLQKKRGSCTCFSKRENIKFFIFRETPLFRPINSMITLSHT